MTTSKRHRWPLLLLGPLLALGGGLGLWHVHVNRDRGPRVPRTLESPWERRDLQPGVIHLKLRGEGYGLGYAQGSALKPEIREMARFLNEDLLGTGGVGRAKRDYLLRGAWKLDPFLAPRYREEIRGMSDATGVPYADLLLINTFDDLTHLSGCSSAVVLGRASSPLLHARNLDYPIPRLAQIKVVRDIETRGLRLRSFGFPGFIGVLTGMSSRGLGLSSHTSVSSRTQLGEPSATLYRRMLEDCGSLEEMRNLLNSAHRTMGNNLAISDGHRNQAWALEFDARGLAVRMSERGRLFVTNHFWDQELQRQQDRRWWVPGSGSQARVACLAQSLPPGQTPALTSMQVALRREGPGKAWRTPANPGTVQSVIMSPRDGQAWFATGSRLPVTRGTYLHLAPAW